MEPPADTSVLVWRYLDLYKFAYMLNNKALTLSRIDKFDDPWEGSLPIPVVERLKDRLTPGTRESAAEFIQSMRTKTYASCWNLSNHESNAMWKLYCGNSQGVAIQTTYAALQDSLKNSRGAPQIRLIRYLDYDQGYFPNPDFSVYDLVTHKDIAFKYESEVRVIRINNQLQEKFHPLPGIKKKELAVTEDLSWDITTVIKSIYIHPLAPEGYNETISALIAKFTPGWTPQIQWSRLRRPPQY